MLAQHICETSKGIHSLSCGSGCVLLINGCLFYYLTPFQLRQYNKALAILERLFKIVEPLGEASLVYFLTLLEWFLLDVESNYHFRRFCITDFAERFG